MAFRVGQKVVCVNDEEQDDRFPCLTNGAIYTVRGYGKPWKRLIREGNDNLPIVLIEEIRRSCPSNDDCGFGEWRFRPLVDISDMESIVTEVFRGKPRKIKDDQFDKHSVRASHPRDTRTKVAVSPDATAGCPLALNGQPAPISLAAGVKAAILLPETAAGGL